MGDLALDVSGVRKIYRGNVEALAGISLRVPKGLVFGLLGPNGAGKSTLVKILTTIIHPTQCAGELLGHPIGHKPTLGRIGYLPEHVRFPDYLTGAQVLDYVGGLAGVPKRVVRERSAALLEGVEMGKWAGRKVSTYSKGMKQRIGIAQALINDPDVVFLDEPTDGVDPGGRIRIRHLIEDLRQAGRTVFVNTHLLSEIEQVADRIAILSKGRIVREGSVRELMTARRVFRIETEEPVSLELAEKLRGDGVEVGGCKLAVEGADARSVQPVIDALRSEGAVIRSLSGGSLSLEELFLEAVEEAEGTGEAA